MNIAVLQFPGSNCDQDAFHLFASGLGLPTRYVWHKDTRLGEADLVVVPGGFSYGDYLRCGAIARFSPVMGAVRTTPGKGGLILGICNGFQILCEAGLLPGALIRNSSLEYRCLTCDLAVEDAGPGVQHRALGRRDPPADRPRRGQLPDRRGRQGEARGEPPDPPSLRGQPQRLAGRHRRHPQRGGQRLRHDAAPGPGLRAVPPEPGRPRGRARGPLAALPEILKKSA
jgi:hypothetical protein